MKPISPTIAARPLFVALLLVVATSACQREQEDIMTTPSDDIAAATPIDTTPVDTMPLPPPMPADPCSSLMGAERDECLRRQIEQVTPPPSDQLPPTQTDTPTMPTPPPAG